MSDQLGFDFPERRARMVESPVVIFRWVETLGKLEAYWPDFGQTTWWRTWAEALPAILHPLNDHVRVKVRL